MSVPNEVRARWSARDRALDQSGVDTSADTAMIRTEIQESWRRCRMTGVAPGAAALPYTADLPEDSRLRRAAEPILSRLAEQLADSGATILLADSAARIVDRRVGSHRMRDRLDDANVAPGFGFAEESSGTNGIGTALEERRLFAVQGGEHYRESLQNLACVGKPIVHPVGRGVEGILDITCDLPSASPLMAPLVEAAVREIEQELYDMASNDERALLEEFLRTSRRGGSAVVTLSNDMVMTNPAAARLLQPSDQAYLWAWACERLSGSDEVMGELQLASDMTVLAKARRLADLRRTMGVVLELRVVPGRRGNSQCSPSGHGPARARLAGRSRATSRLNAELDLVANQPGPTLITGEPGVGKRHAARRLHDVWASPDSQLHELDLGLIEGSRARYWGFELRHHLARGATVVLHNVAGADPALMPHLMAAIDRSVEQGWRLIVTGPEIAEGLIARVQARFDRRVAISPLTLRDDEIEDLANEILAERARPGRGAQRIQPAVLQALRARSWPGNVRELRSVIESAAARALGGDIALQHLPTGYRQPPTAKVHSVLERAELDALLTVLAECRGNKALAARRLGVARSTLYRKVREFGIDTDRFISP
ncbi:sigma-54-dependent Fis family transcriptional regulator [Blastococcus sp. Marseille-P5729]|uniref:sigma-54-dependent Fis family transcriptional regulator n=1 Tax=Blastococcus sp. Marseille-P5729 TaxID=2086582 RepID=UPI000D10FF78|nr:helix-turn-helix domain-containing protein [Blastococcus sp. Marseille-P5729]